MRTSSLTIGKAYGYGGPTKWKAASEQSAASRLVAPAFLVGLALSPIVFGGNVPLAWGTNAFVFGLLLALYALPQMATGRAWPVPLSRIKVPACCFAAALLWIAFQAQTWWVPASLE